VPCYKRPEYTKRCIEAIEKAQKYKDTIFYLVDDGSSDGTIDTLLNCDLNKYVVQNPYSMGLRRVIIDFMDWVKKSDYNLIGKIDNDCIVPKGFLSKILQLFVDSPADILSPNVFPSDAAFKYGSPDVANFGYRPAKVVGGLWFMRKEIIKGIDFERHDILGIKGAFNIIKQIILDRDPIVGWIPDLTFQDLGHWSGKHPEHIKTGEHELYYQEVGRKIAW